jgi:hypothetical protein
MLPNQWAAFFMQLIIIFDDIPWVLYCFTHLSTVAAELFPIHENAPPMITVLLF